MEISWKIKKQKNCQKKKTKLFFNSIKSNSKIFSKNKAAGFNWQIIRSPFLFVFLKRNILLNLLFKCTRKALFFSPYRIFNFYCIELNYLFLKKKKRPFQLIVSFFFFFRRLFKNFSQYSKIKNNGVKTRYRFVNKYQFKKILMFHNFLRVNVLWSEIFRFIDRNREFS